MGRLLIAAALGISMLALLILITENDPIRIGYAKLRGHRPTGDLSIDDIDVIDRTSGLQAVLFVGGSTFTICSLGALISRLF